MTRWIALAFCFVALSSCVSTSTEDEIMQSDAASVEAQGNEAHDEMTKEVVGLSAGIRPVENMVLGDQPVEILFYLSNNTEGVVQVLPWSTPLEQTLAADLFAVSFNGDRLPYIGPVVKRAAPSDEDYLTLQPAEKVETVVNLSRGYDMLGVGDYQIVLEQLYLQSADGEIKAAIVEDTVTVSRQ